MNILVAEPLSPAGLAILQKNTDWNVIVSSPKEYDQHLAEADALVVRSAVKVTREVLAKAPKLRAIGRAGVGVDNVDLAAATEAGVIVMNTPGGNAISVAEHTLALMLAMARHVAAASESTKGGKWEKKRFMGNELREKVLGLVGLGTIGRGVLQRAQAFEMRILAYDPFVNPESVRSLDVTMVSLDELYAQSDFISLHTALTPETKGMLDAAAFAKMKPGARIVNCARGELVNHEALAAALESGHLGGAALDVFEVEPLKGDEAFLKLPSLVATPHIAASTEEAQEIVGVRIAQQLSDYLRDGVAINAVNMPQVSPAEYRQAEPFMHLAERLGEFASRISQGSLRSVRITYFGDVAENTQLIRNAGLVGAFRRAGERANIVNVMQVAAARGVNISEQHENVQDHGNAIHVELETTEGRTRVGGAVVLDRPRLLRVDGISVETPLSGDLVYMRNVDVPGVIGHVGKVLGDNQINIANFSLGREERIPTPDAPLEAVAVVETDGLPSDAVLEELKKNPAVRIVRVVSLSR
ncbi:MAG: phosphoglycerate dehydrogenase [Bryobacterales bacterium]|nr:phosphoglycerate dehydrogenase [Bryobacterales bacterium]